MRIHLLMAATVTATSLYGHMERDGSRDIVTDTSRALMWQDSRDNDLLRLGWDAARTYCDGLVFAGFDDWRLPAREELLSIIDPNKQKVAGMVHPLNEHFLHANMEVYWSGDPVQSDDALAWRVNYEGGTASWGAKRFEFYVRCVRPNP